MISYIDTQKVEDISNEVLSATKDLGAEFDALFERFSNVPVVTKEWIGGRAEFYFAKVAEDRKGYVELVRELRQIANELKAEAADAQVYIEANNTDE